MVSRRLTLWLVLIAALGLGCSDSDSLPAPPPPDGLTVDSSSSTARSANGEFIYWREHLIDGIDVNGGTAIRGGDGLALGDLDGDGLEDVVSVHEDSGHVRVAYATGNPNQWHLATLAEADVDGAEDVVIADLDGDSDLDVAVAAERGHLIYFENPGALQPSTEVWDRTIPERTLGRGSFIRVSAADFDGDGRLELAAANKGASMSLAGMECRPSPETIGAVINAEPSPISIFTLPDNPLLGTDWSERELARYRVPINALPVDLDGDGDPDVIGGARGKLDGLVWFENESGNWIAHDIALDADAQSVLRELSALPLLSGQTLEIHDFNEDGRADILTLFSLSAFGWLEQPADILAPWSLHLIGDIAPDHAIGLTIADIDGDGNDDILVGGYSKGPRDRDDQQECDALGRLAWFQAVRTEGGGWIRHEISRRIRGMFDELIARDLDRDGDVDFIGTRGNSGTFDGVFWLEQTHSSDTVRNFLPARLIDSGAVALPHDR